MDEIILTERQYAIINQTVNNQFVIIENQVILQSMIQNLHFMLFFHFLFLILIYITVKYILHYIERDLEHKQKIEVECIADGYSKAPV
jgi:hypothetical protein